jgi:hypothetical protein
MSDLAVSATGYWTAVYFGGGAKFCAGVKGDDIRLQTDKNSAIQRQFERL